MVARPFGLSWQQLASYSPLNASPAAADGAEGAHSSPESSRFPSRAYPRIADVLSSRRFRLWVPIVVTVWVVLAVGHHYDALPGVSAGWSKGADPYGPRPGSPATGSGSGTGADNSDHDDAAARVDWSRFAYTQYVTDSHYLCNSVMLFERLQHLGSRAERVMMYPSHMFDPSSTDPAAISNDARLLMRARDEYNARLVPIEVQRRNGGDRTWAESFTKLLAFNQTQYDRVLSLDSDSVVMQNMDELFLLPPTPVAMPRAYWLYPDKEILASHIMLVQPSAAEFARVQHRIDTAGHGDYDMEIVNYLYRDSALVLPHRPYGMLTAEMRREGEKHKYYLGTDDPDAWDPVAAYNEAKFVHFSDWPVSKPWLATSESVMKQHEPKCHVRNGVESCLERDFWNGFYTEFRERRKRVCGPVPGEPSRRRRAAP